MKYGFKQMHSKRKSLFARLIDLTPRMLIDPEGKIFAYSGNLMFAAINISGSYRNG